MIIKAHLGVIPWDVLNQGLVHRVGLSVGLWSMIVGGVVLLSWIPLRERPGVGTVTNVVLVGILLDFYARVFPTPAAMPTRMAFLLVGVALNGLGTAVYLGSALGSGARDGLMTGFVRITGRSVRLVRTCIEVVVVAAGAMLGGNLGFGTIFFALSIGPLVHAFLPVCALDAPWRVALRGRCEVSADPALVEPGDAA